MKPDQSHVAGLELARSVIEENWPADALLEIVDNCLVEAKSAPAEVAQGEAIPVAAQARFRRPEKGAPDWSPWQPAAIRCAHPSWYIDTQGWETEYRLLYTAPPSPDAELVELLREVSRNNLALGMLGLEMAKRIAAKLAEVGK